MQSRDVIKHSAQGMKNQQIDFQKYPNTFQRVSTYLAIDFESMVGAWRIILLSLRAVNQYPIRITIHPCPPTSCTSTPPPNPNSSNAAKSLRSSSSKRRLRVSNKQIRKSTRLSRRCSSKPAPKRFPPIYPMVHFAAYRCS